MMIAARAMASHLKTVRGRGRRAGRRGLMNRKPTLGGVDSRRALPSVTKVLAALTNSGGHPRTPGGDIPHGLAVGLARDVVDEARARVEAGETVVEEEVLAEARRRAAAVGRSLLQPVVNATGVIVHTNLG